MDIQNPSGDPDTGGSSKPSQRPNRRGKRAKDTKKATASSKVNSSGPRIPAQSRVTRVVKKPKARIPRNPTTPDGRKNIANGDSTLAPQHLKDTSKLDSATSVGKPTVEGADNPETRVASSTLATKPDNSIKAGNVPSNLPVPFGSHSNTLESTRLPSGDNVSYDHDQVMDNPPARHDHQIGTEVETKRNANQSRPSKSPARAKSCATFADSAEQVNTTFPAQGPVASVAQYVAAKRLAPPTSQAEDILNSSPHDYVVLSSIQRTSNSLPSNYSQPGLSYRPLLPSTYLPRSSAQLRPSASPSRRRGINDKKRERQADSRHSTIKSGQRRQKESTLANDSLAGSAALESTHVTQSRKEGSNAKIDGFEAKSRDSGMFAVQDLASQDEIPFDYFASHLDPTDRSVIEYLCKKGYTRTEAMLRLESANQDAEGKPIHARAEDAGGQKYGKALGLMQQWIEETIEIYKPDLRRLLWPIFVHSFLNLVSDYYPKDSRIFFNTFKGKFEKEHESDLRALEPISLPEHVLTNDIAKIYRGARYRVTISTTAFYALCQFLETKEKEGGTVLLSIISSYLNVVNVERAADDQHGLAKLVERARTIEDFPAEDEGIPGHNPGSANLDRNAGSTVLTRLKLGPLPIDPDLMADVRAELESEDAVNPPFDGQSSLTQHFEQHIKREESEDAPNRTDIPLPQAVARDVAMEVQKIRENRDRFKIEGRTGGVGPAVSITMFTFQNSFDTITCLDFSQDNLLVAAGTSESYIRVESLEGKNLPSALPSSTQQQPSASRRLIGHSAPVYGVSFSPSIASPYPLPVTTASKHLLSCSADKTVRLWSLDTWSCLVVYKGHDDTVWDVTWGPHGHYFLTGSHDRTARLWSTDQISYLRMFVGHDLDVDCVAFHPNGAYVFTGSCDKMVRMWAVSNGYPVRMFTGHSGNITSLACSPNGKLLASADDAGTIILWDLGPGRLLKRMRGHGKGGVWSLSWSVESTVLVSGGADNTVRVWDVAVPNDASGQVKAIGSGDGAGAGGQVKLDGSSAAANGNAGIAGGVQAAGVGATGAGAGGKKKGKEVVVTSDQIGAFATKKSPVYKVRFTRQNLVVAGGAYLP